MTQINTLKNQFLGEGAEEAVGRLGRDLGRFPNHAHAPRRPLKLFNVF